MSYDVSLEVDTGGREPLHIEPEFNDEHPAIVARRGGGAITTVSWRCGGYTSNVSGMWTRCLTATATPEQMRWAGDDARAFNASGRTASRYDAELDEWCSGPLLVRDDQLALRDLAGKTGEELAPLLRAAVAWGIAHLGELHAMNPPNGWGDADGAITFLWDLQRLCEAHPRARLYVSS